MKVIKREPWPQPWHIQRTCRMCGSVVEIDGTDLVRRVERADRPNEADTTYFEWACTVCKTHNRVASSDVPEATQKAYWP